MEGDKAKNQYGISQRTIHKVFSMLEDKAEQQKKSIVPQDDGTSVPSFEYSIEVGMLEIYNDDGEQQQTDHVFKFFSSISHI